mmetsp:Transcript_5194/g.13019  ORF Transcript_5194/g.13019 Transcript_5194/m.13019 type:complete len:492 (+) Transcript_5194:70-1545(+)
MAATTAISSPAKLVGRITVYSISGCPYCKRAKGFLAEHNLPYTEINLDVYPTRRAEMVSITQRHTVPQIFFNAEHIGGSDDLLSLSDEKLNEFIELVRTTPAGADAPRVPDEDEKQPVEEDDEHVSCEPDRLHQLAVRMREPTSGVSIKDRIYHLRTYKRCFVGSQAVDWLLENTECTTREEAVALGNEMLESHLFHHVCHDHIFKDDYYFYRFLADASNKALNSKYESSCEPRPAPVVAREVRQRILKLYERFLSPSGDAVDYKGIGESEEFAQYCEGTAELKRVDVVNISREEKLAFFINIYNALVIHATVVTGKPKTMFQRKNFFTNISYIIGGHKYSLNDIENGVLRANRRPPYAWSRQFPDKSDPRLAVCLEQPEPRIHFALVCGAKSCPPIKTYSAEEVDEQLTAAAQAFFESENLVVNGEKKTISLSKILDWYKVDFGNSDAEMIAWISNFAPVAVAEQLDSFDKSWKITYQTYDWTSNSKDDD